jgi:hypothetical protein
MAKSESAPLQTKVSVEGIGRQCQLHTKAEIVYGQTPTQTPNNFTDISDSITLGRELTS